MEAIGTFQVLFVMLVIFNTGGGHFNYATNERISRCGERPSRDDYSLLSRIVGGTTAKKLEFPWVISLRRGETHICGGTIISERYILTAAHCVIEKSKDVKVYKVHVGVHDFTIKEENEEVYSIAEVIIHPKFMQSIPINYDIAIVKLKNIIIFGPIIRPACLPSPDEIFLPGFLCIALGWGRMKENGPASKILQQVTLPIYDHKECMKVMKTLGSGAVFLTAICAGFPEGGKDACQGDSGGPLICLRGHKTWVVVGITSWGHGCARSWLHNKMLPPEKRGSPGAYTDVKIVLDWINLTLNLENSNMSSALSSCSLRDEILQGTSGTLKVPKAPHKYYLNNEKCKWTIIVPEGQYILITFEHFDVEYDHSCYLDYLVVYLGQESFIGRFCGSDLPRPLLIKKNKVNLKFISDFQEYRTGFQLSYLAVEPGDYTDSQCGSVAVISGEGEIQTMNHPGKYTSNANCKWIITCPVSFWIKVTFHAFEVEPSKGCVFDYVLIYHDLEGNDVAGKFCGLYIPDPVESTSNIMQIIFSSDTRANYVGFRAMITFHSDQSREEKSKDSEGSDSDSSQSFENQVADFETGCVAAPTPPVFLTQSITVAEEAFPGSWPWHGRLLIGLDPFCNVVIVNKKFVLTAASCVAQKKEFLDLFLVVTGIHDLERIEDAQKRAITQIFLHPKYVLNGLENDIALMQLKEPLQFDEYIQPVCFSHSYGSLRSSSICIVTSWGLNEEGEMSTKLQQLEAPLEKNAVCESFYGKIPGSVFCAGTAKGQAKHTCRGQVGSPLVCPTSNPKTFYIYGISIRGVGCLGTKPGLYTKVPVYADWIETILKAEESSEVDHQRNNEPDLMSNSQEQSGALSSGNSSPSVYTECKGVMSLESPGEVKLVADSQGRPDGFSCQLKFQAPVKHFIMLVIEELNSSQRHDFQVLVYEGPPDNKTLKAEMSVDSVPGTINSTGPVLTVEAKTRTQLRLRMSYTHHNGN